MNEQQYHIDVTPEEEALFQDKDQITNDVNKPKFAGVFWLVLGAHIAVIGTIITTCSAMGSKPAVDLKQPVAEIPETVQSDVAALQAEISANSPVEQPEQTPEQPISSPQKSVPVVSSAPVIKTSEPAPQPNNSKYVKTYTIKKGDTIYSISKKYKLNTEKLIKINNIKDPNNIKVGQVLKFM